MKNNEFKSGLRDYVNIKIENEVEALTAEINRLQTEVGIK